MIPCTACQTMFSPRSSKARFCSLTCSYIVTNREKGERKRQLYEANPDLCADCGKIISYKQHRDGNKYCSRSCGKSKKTKHKEQNCPTCGSIFTAKSKQTYCSTKCYKRTHVHKLTDQKIEAGLVNTARTLRQYLRRHYGDFCVECGQSSIYNYKPLCLQVDHVDGNPDNNFPENLRLLCPNCHSQTPTYKGGNTKNNQRSRYRREWRLINKNNASLVQ